MDACERYLNAIHELIDGTLGPIRRAELELHLESCDRCRALAADLQEIARTAQSLDDIEPSARVWTAVSARLRAERGMTAPAKPLVVRRSLTLLAMAAALVLAVGASLFLLGRTPATPVAPPISTGPTAAAPSGNAAPDDPVQNVVKELAATETQFQRLVEASEASNTIDAKTAAAMQKNLQVMNEAIKDTRKALDVDPQNAPAQSSLYDVLKQKIQFLQETIALMNMMRQGDAAGAAEIVESGKS